MRITYEVGTLRYDDGKWIAWYEDRGRGTTFEGNGKSESEAVADLRHKTLNLIKTWERSH